MTEGVLTEHIEGAIAGVLSVGGDTDAINDARRLKTLYDKAPIDRVGVEKRCQPDGWQEGRVSLRKVEVSLRERHRGAKRQADASLERVVPATRRREVIISVEKRSAKELKLRRLIVDPRRTSDWPKSTLAARRIWTPSKRTQPFLTRPG